MSADTLTHTHTQLYCQGLVSNQLAIPVLISHCISIDVWQEVMCCKYVSESYVEAVLLVEVLEVKLCLGCVCMKGDIGV